MSSLSGRLAVEDHNRAYAGMRYVYPVVSRRAQGVSVGINLNPNNACNWRCIYCQVPQLTRGGPPPIDLAVLAAELEQMLDDIVHGDFMMRYVDPAARVLQDIAFSGNGEPTSAAEFPQAVMLAEAARRRFLAAAPALRLRLISNGSLLDRPRVQEGIRLLGEASGEVWFKCDAGNTADALRVNGSRQQPAAVLRRLARCAGLCSTWVQSCWFGRDGMPPSASHVNTWLDLLAEYAHCGHPELAGVLLYGLARPSFQPEALRLSRLPEHWLIELAQRVEALGYRVRVYP